MTGSMEPTGVRLIAENSDAYLRTIENARGATINFNDAAAAAGAGFQTMSIGAMAASVAIGTLLAQATAAAISGVINLAKAGVEMASSLQDTQIALESLIAQEILSTGAASSMTEAMQESVPVTEAVMERLKEISLISPFEYQKILSVFQMNKAFGQSIEMSLDLTKAITDLGAVNKNVPGILERLSYNFSQMALTGQITARDLRDLSQAGLSLGKVLENQLGKSIDQVNDDLKSGALTFEDVSRSFVNYVEENLGGAAERASRTFSGLKSSFNDLAFFSSIDVFGGALDVVTDKLGGLFDKAQGFVAEGGLKPVGAVLEVLAEQLLGAGEAAAQAGSDFYAQFGTKIADTATAAADWGANVVQQLASGLIDGAAAALGAAMDYIGGLLSWFLAPGSPPRVAPEIDRWGADAMREFLGGFQDADFSVLKSIGSGLNSALSALVGAGELDREDQLGIFQGLSGQLAEVMASGGDLGPLLENIRGSLGAYGQDVALLVERQTALQGALEGVRAAEEALKQARQDETKANEDLVRITDEYNELARAGASPEVLAAKRAEFEAAKQRQKTATQARKEAEQGLTTSKEEASALKEKADLQAQLVSQLIELTKSQKEAEKAEKKAAGSGKAGAGAATKPKPGGGLPGLNPDAIAENLKQKMEELKENLRQKFADFWKPLTDKWDEAEAYLRPKWDAFYSTLSGIYEQYIAPVLDGMGKLIPEDFAENVGWAAGVLLTLAAALGVAALAVGALTLVLQSPILPILAVIATLALLKTAWDEDWGGMRTTLTNLWNNYILKVVTDIQTWMADNLPKALDTLRGFWEETLLPAMESVWEFVEDYLLPLFETMVDFIETSFDLALTVLAGIWENVLAPAIEGVWEWFAEKLDPAMRALQEFIDRTFGPAIEGLAGFFSNVLEGAIDGVKGAIDRTILGLERLMEMMRRAKDSLPDWMTPGSPTPWENGLRGVIAAMDELNRASLPRMQAGLAGTARAYNADAAAARMHLAHAPGEQRNERNYNLTLQTTMNAQTVAQGFEFYRLMGV